MGFIKPAPVAAETRTPGCGCGFPGVRVRVSLENPRVARAEPYTHTHLRLPRHQHEATTPASNATQKRPKQRSVPSSGPPAPSVIKGEHPDRLTGGSETRLMRLGF